jgi:hypothetical protein
MTASLSHGKPLRAQPQARDSYPVFREISTRWSDNDVYGHVNNVIYYSWFDTAVNAYLIEQGALDIHDGQTIGLVIETQCNYFASLAFRKPWKRVFAWPIWAAPACATKWVCLPGREPVGCCRAFCACLCRQTDAPACAFARALACGTAATAACRAGW